MKTFVRSHNIVIKNEQRMNLYKSNENNDMVITPL